jgi:hypothetical protein
MRRPVVVALFRERGRLLHHNAIARKRCWSCLGELASKIATSPPKSDGSCGCGTTDTFVNRIPTKPTKTCTERTPFECKRGNKTRSPDLVRRSRFWLQHEEIDHVDQDYSGSRVRRKPNRVRGAILRQLQTNTLGEVSTQSAGHQGISFELSDHFTEAAFGSGRRPTRTMEMCHEVRHRFASSSRSHCRRFAGLGPKQLA